MDIGINPLKKMKKNEVAIGGKVFNYLSCGRPVLSSRMIALERFLGDEIYYYDDEDSFVQQVESILDQLRRGQVSAERNRSIAERYDWRSLAGQYEAAIKRAID
jgi:glycosyltransferase involved in cell wall biosynthesis